MADVKDSSKTQDANDARDWRETLFLPKTAFPMKAGLPKREPEILERWQKMDLFQKMRDDAKGREKFVLHDGPPYANGHLHIGHALNKILKDVITRSFQMMGYDSNYVPGWDCHGLPIEWKIEEQYRAKGKNKDEVPINEFRKECREFADHWIKVQAEEFQRLGVEGNFKDPYTTMNFHAEARIAQELMKFATSDQLYRGSKPVMWSVVERTALAEAEIEYEDYESDTIWCKFPIAAGSAADDLKSANIVIWTTTPWTIPGNRAICFSHRIAYSLFEVTEADSENWAKPGDQLILADELVEDVMAKARVEAYKKVRAVSAEELAEMICHHPLRNFAEGEAYSFDVPLLDGDHVTAEAGTGFVHTSPSHGRDDFDIWMAKKTDIELKGVDSTIPYPVAADGRYTKDAPGFEGAQVITDKGKKGDANKVVLAALTQAGALIARGRLKHQYPHSWRSKKPVIFRNTPQWFVAMDKGLGGNTNDTLRERALKAIEDTRFVPQSGQNRLHAMIENRPDWVVSRQRAWGVPISVFVHVETGKVLKDDEVNARILAAFEEEGADAWFADGAKERFLGKTYDSDEWEKVDDILDVWFDSGSTHSFVLEDREELKWPADVYLEGTDQHRGWFHSSLLESCGTRGRAPYDTVITHGFTMDEHGKKMSKSLGNQTAPQDVIKQYGADILRLWVMSCDYAEDQRIGQEIIKTNVDAYRKIRNSLRWMLGTLSHYKGEQVAYKDMPELEQLMLHQLARQDKLVRQAYRDFDFKKIISSLSNFMNIELSAFYFDVRKDVLYCDPISSPTRKAALQVVSHLFECLTAWLAPMIPFSMEEAWLSRRGPEGESEESSIHLQQFPEIADEWHNPDLSEKWQKIMSVRRVVTGALEIERREKRIGSSLDAAPIVYIEDKALAAIIETIDMAEIFITSQAQLSSEPAPEDSFRLDEIAGIAVTPALAKGEKCARSWKITEDVGSDPDYPDLSARDAQAVREFDA